jgi:catechol 2,3-dioxygenase-like lactoylglutathione lyase family enzyme
MISDIHHVSINVDDLAAAEHFYTEILGIPKLPRPDLGIGGAWLGVGSSQIHLIELDTVPDDLGQHFALRVDDIDSAIAHLQKHGIEVSDIFETPVSRQVALHDPCGNGVELNQPK